MSIDNRVDINDCEDDAQTFTTSGGALGTNTSAGDFYEGAASVETQHSNNNDETDTTTDSAGTTLNLDLSDATAYLLVKDNLLDTFAQATGGNGGAQYVLGDGTDLIGYPVGGNDAVGMPLPFFFNAFKLDVSEVVASPPGNVAVYAGSEAALDQTAISRAGYGSLHLAKAVGNIANVRLDAMCYIANGSYALTINGGTVGTPETMADVQGDDVGGLLTGLGYGGMVANPLGSQFQFFAPTEWGDAAAANSYFQADDEQWYWLGDNAGGHPVGATHFPFRLIGNATGTNSFVLNTVVIVNTGTRAQFDLSNADMDIVKLTAVAFTDLGAITLPAQDVGNKFLADCVFNNCDQVDPSTCDMDNTIFNGTTDANGALFIDEAGASSITGAVFNSDGTGHAIHLRPTGAGPFAITFDAHAYNGYTGTGTDAAVYYDPVTSAALTTITIIGDGETPTIRTAAGATTPTIVNNKTVTFTGLQLNSEVRAYLTGTNTEIDGVENSGATFAFNVGSGVAFDYVIINPGWVDIRVENVSTTTDQSILINQFVDRNYIEDA